MEFTFLCGIIDTEELYNNDLSNLNVLTENLLVQKDSVF